MLHASGVSRSGVVRRYLARIFAVVALTAGMGAMAADDTTKGVEGESVLSEVVVTATRRAENIQSIPVSIAAITADDIQERGLVSEEDYLRSIPGVNQVGEDGSTAVIIRGLETSPSFQNFASGPTVATYFGETPTTNTSGLTGGSNVDLKLVDVERVEVLRGPQGTTFGDSSLGGAVRIIPVAPKLDGFSGEVAANYSSTSGFGGSNDMLQAVLNVPLIADKLAVRLVGYEFTDSGFYRNVAGSDPAFLAAAASYGALPYAVNQNRVGDTRYIGGRITALWQATDDLKLSAQYVSQNTYVDGSAFATIPGTYEQEVYQLAPQQLTRGGQTGGVDDSNIELLNLTLEYNLGWAGLLTTFSHVESGSLNTFPSVFYVDQPYPYSYLSAHGQDSGEIRLVSKLTGPWNFIGGIYSENLKDNNYQTYYWNGSAAANPYPPSPLIGSSHDTRDEKQNAIFGELSYEFLHGFTLTGGVRGYKYHRTDQQELDGTLFGGPSPSYVAGDASGASGKANLSYKYSDVALVYAGWSQGFRLGKPQPELPTVCGSNGLIEGTNIPIASTGFVKSDSVNNYEVGTKLTFLDRRLIVDADIYREYWANVPVTTNAPLPPQGCGLSYVANAAAATSQGIEFQANYYLTSSLRADLGVSTTDAKLTTNAPGLDASAGARLPGSPKVNANAALQYSFEAGGHKIVLRADSYYVGTFYGDLQETPDLKSGGYVKTDASAKMMFNKLGVELFVHNLTNAENFTWHGNFDEGNGFGYRLRPRTIGVQLHYGF